MDLEELSEIGYEQKNPSGISMKVYRDGMFVFDLADWEEGLVSLDTDLPNQEAALRSVQAMTRNRIKLLNTHLACLYTAIARIDGLTQVKMELSPWNLLGFQSFDGKMKPVSPRSEKSFTDSFLSEGLK